MASYTFVTGHSYFAGFDKPWYASRAAIKAAVEGKGFQVLGDWPCTKMPQLPVQVPGRCGDQWDWLALVRRTGPTLALELPSQVKWVVDTTPGAPAGTGPQPPPQPPQEPPPPGGDGFPPPRTPGPQQPARGAGAGLALGLVAAGLGWLVIRSRS